jgi:hypothetical protein
MDYRINQWLFEKDGKVELHQFENYTKDLSNLGENENRKTLFVRNNLVAQGVTAFFVSPAIPGYGFRFRDEIIRKMTGLTPFHGIDTYYKEYYSIRINSLQKQEKNKLLSSQKTTEELIEKHLNEELTWLELSKDYYVNKDRNERKIAVKVKVCVDDYIHWIKQKIKNINLKKAELKNSKGFEDKVKVKEKYLNVVYIFFSRYFPENEHVVLKDLLESGEIDQRITFQGAANQLCDAFFQLHSAKILTSIDQKNLIEYMAKYFSFYKNGKPAKLTKPTANKTISGNDTSFKNSILGLDASGEMPILTHLLPERKTYIDKNYL